MHALMAASDFTVSGLILNLDEDDPEVIYLNVTERRAK